MSSVPPLPAAILEALQAGYERLELRNQSVLLAVSGGGDSLGLMYASAVLAGSLGLQLSVGSVDHGLRQASAAEVAQVGRYASALGLPHHSATLSLAPGPGLEARARSARYQALEILRVQVGAAVIATAHTADDQAETLLMRLSRGASLRGARSILSRRGRVVRPLLGVSRAEVRSAIESLGLVPAADPMNDDPAYFRARVRRTVLPALREAAGPSSVFALARFAEAAAEDEAVLAALADEAWARLTLPNGSLDAPGTRALLPALQGRVLRRLLESQGLPVDRGTLERARSALQRRGRTALPRRTHLDCLGPQVRVVWPPGSLAGPEARAEADHYTLRAESPDEPAQKSEEK